MARDHFSPPMSRRGLLQLSGGVALVLSVGACAEGSKSSGTPGASSGTAASTLKIAVSSYPSSWDQDFVGFDPTALMLFKNVFPYMIDYGVTTASGSQILDTGNITPTFAESFQPDSTGKVWTLKLRQGVKFASGNEMKADDVVWSKQRAFAAQANVAGIYRTIGLTEASQVVKVDDYTVEFHQAFASALTKQIQAISLYVFDSVEAKKHATGSDPWAKAWFAKNAPTGGYYNVGQATQGQEIDLAANSAYPGPDGAKTANIKISVVSSAASQRLQLQSGDIDIAFGITGQDLQDLKKAGGVKVISAASDNQVAIQMSVTTAPFDDVNVRKALAYAVNYDQIIKNVYGGDARATKSPVPLDMPGYSETGYPYSYDVAQAKAALAASGRTAVSSELVIEAGNDEQQKIAIQVQSAAAAVGITLKISALDPATLGQRRTDKSIPLQVTAGSLWVNDVEYMLATSFVKGAALNYSNYSNPEIEQIYSKSHTTTDDAARKQLWAQVQTILAADVPWVILCQPNFNLPVREGVTGWVQPMDGLARLRYLSVTA